MHQADTALLAAPLRLAASIGAQLRRSIPLRVALAVGLALVSILSGLAVTRPLPTVATPPTAIVPLTQAAFTTAVATNQGVIEPVTITFSTPMDPRSVATALQVEPATAVALAWNDARTVLTVSPDRAWSAGVFHTVTVQAGALAQTGQPLARPARALFLTRAATSSIAHALDVVGDRVALRTAFEVAFARPVDPATVATAVRLDPPTAGTVEAVETPGATLGGPTRYRFVPAVALLPNVDYRLFVSGVRDLDGLPLDSVMLPVRTIDAPAVVRFRPTTGTGNVARDAELSVRFTERMERRSTARAFTVRSGGKVLAGTVRWAEHDTVLVFTPAAALPASTAITMDVGSAALSVTGAPIAAAARATFKTASKEAALGGSGSAVAITGGSAVGGGSWGNVETYYLGLMNCTRTGGWVTKSGTCSSPGGRNVAPLKLDRGISSNVARPYARRLAIGADCSHFIGGNPGDRLRRAGYTSYRWAENIGCRSGNPMAAVLGTHLFYQSEKSYNGGHYVNLMSTKYDRVGIGVWVSGGRVRLVIDFYHP